ncbi:DUF4347 domain-containing protein [Roseomonas rosulenta]|uniref:DUF4347 domain-containing protein n=1 Tax=Roseomonas rosulenta TaxID=2748667 RepID=UPI0018DF1E75|nr:DUF4347 domain-containing protein [Roseomonas rosulenta]
MKTTAATLYVYDPQFEANAKAFQEEIGGDCAIRPVTGFDDLVKALDSYTQVGFLVFDTHGEPGKVALADGSRVEGFDFRLLRLLPKELLRKDARVLFYGCNIGEGAAGDTFLDDFGLAAFRGKGGTAGASTVTNFSLSLGPLGSVETWMELESPFAARLKVARFNEAGTREASMSVDRWGNRD